jgi:hypothetical protein
MELHITIYGLNLVFFYCLCNLLARVQKVTPLFLELSFWTQGCWVCASTIKRCYLASESCVSVQVSHNISWRLIARITETVVFSPPLSSGCSPGPLGEVIPPDSKGQLDPEERLVFSASWGESLRSIREPGEAQEPAMWAPPVRLVRTQVWIQACLKRQKGRLITSQRPPSNPTWGKTRSLRFRDWGESMWDTSRN